MGVKVLISTQYSKQILDILAILWPNIALSQNTFNEIVTFNEYFIYIGNIFNEMLLFKKILSLIRKYLQCHEIKWRNIFHQCI